MGEANDLDQVVEAATLLRDRGENGVAFVLQGEGKRRAGIEDEVRRRGLSNVKLLPGGDKESAARLAAASDACLTIFKDVPVLATNSPNKLFDTFAAGRPAIVNTDGWQRELVERGAGLFARPGDPADLAAQVLALRDDPALAKRLGEGARRLAEEEFDRRLLAERLRAVLEVGLMDLSYCVVNTNGRDYLLACLDAIERTHPAGVEHEVLVLDNCSDDGSVAAVEASAHDARVIALDRRTGKAENDSTLLREARGPLLPAAERGLRAARGRHRGAARGARGRARARPWPGAQLLSSEGERKACAWRLPGVPAALAGALFLHRLFTVQSRGRSTRRVGWTQSSAMLVRREAAADGRTSSTRTSSSTPTRPTSASACTTPAGTCSTCPAPRRCTTTS